jgi:hypothetical protein
MAKNPTVDDLNNPEKFEKLTEVTRDRIKEFVLEQIRTDKVIIPVFMVYQIILVLIGTFFATRSVVLIIRGYPEQFYWTLGAVIFSFSILVFLHELLHGLALLMTGAKKIRFGGNIRNFIFFAEANQHVMNRNQFRFVALTPLFVIQILTLWGLVVFLNVPAVYLFITIMSLHSLFCAGDIALLSFFEKFRHEKIYTYDSKDGNRTFYFRLIKQ